MVFAIATAPSSVTPTRARKIESVTWRMLSLISAKIRGSDTPQTIRDRPLAFMAAAGRGLERRSPAAHPSRGERDRVRVAIQVHDHAGEQGAALVVLAQVEVVDIECQIRRDVLQPAVLPDLEVVV